MSTENMFFPHCWHCWHLDMLMKIVSKSENLKKWPPAIRASIGAYNFQCRSKKVRRLKFCKRWKLTILSLVVAVKLWQHLEQILLKGFKKLIIGREWKRSNNTTKFQTMHLACVCLSVYKMQNSAQLYNSE